MARVNPAPATTSTGRKQELALGPRRPRKSRIERGQRQVECLCHRDIPRIVTSKCVSQFPYALGERLEWIAFDAELHAILKCRCGLEGRNLFSNLQSTKDVDSLGQDNLRTVNRVAADGSFCPPSVRPNVYGYCNNNGSVDDDGQRRSASRCRKILVAERRVFVTDFRFRTASSHLSTEGREAILSSSARRYSCIDLPCSAARAASSSRTLSGTSRIVICTLMHAFYQH